MFVGTSHFYLPVSCKYNPCLLLLVGHLAAEGPNLRSTCVQGRSTAARADHCWKEEQKEGIFLSVGLGIQVAGLISTLQCAMSEPQPCVK